MSSLVLPLRRRLRLPRLAWPLPALATWLAAWAANVLLLRLQASAEAGLLAGLLLSLAMSWPQTTRWRRLFVAGGFPLSYVAAGLAGPLPAWAWLLPLAVLALLYPRRAWTDAPLFPTPCGALRELAAAVPLPASARVLDAGCGLGAGLAELRRAYPQVRLEGIEWSRPLRLVCAWRRPDAVVRRGDMWAASWADHDLVYLFQRPESLPRALDKARREMRPGAWLASLEFFAAGVTPTAQLRGADGRPVWLYRMPSVAGEPSPPPAAAGGSGVQIPAETP